MTPAAYILLAVAAVTGSTIPGSRWVTTRPVAAVLLAVITTFAALGLLLEAAVLRAGAR